MIARAAKTQGITLPIRSWRRYAEFKRRYPKLMAEVARELVVSHGFIIQVVKGLSQSRRVHEHLQLKMAERDKQRREGIAA
jgi:hypothetical protein